MKKKIEQLNQRGIVSLVSLSIFIPKSLSQADALNMVAIKCFETELHVFVH